MPERFQREIALHLVTQDAHEQPVAGGVPHSEGWVPLNLGQICTKIGSGATPRGGQKVYLSCGPCALIRSQNVFNDGFRTAGIAYIGSEHASALQNVEVAAGDVLLNITGDSVARVCQVHPCMLPARVNQHVAIIRPDPTKLDPLFLRYFLSSPRIQSELLSLAGSGGTRNALTKAMIQSLVVAAPSDVDQQRAIADILGALDDKIELNRRMNETLEAMARAIFKDWFVDFGPVRAKTRGKGSHLSDELTNLFPNTIEPEGTPSGWQRGTLSEIAISPTRITKPQNVSAATPYIGLAHMPRRSISLVDWGNAEAITSTKYAFMKGEILFGKLRPYFHKVGIAPTDGICSTDIVVLNAITSDWYAFVLALVSSEAFIDYTSKTSTGTKMPRTSWRSMSRFEILLPPQKLVRAFQSLVRPFIDLIGVNIQQSRILKTTRDVLLPKLISGEIRIEDAEKMVDSVA